MGRIFDSGISPAAGKFLAAQRVVVAATLDAKQRPWASLLTGPAGFAETVDESLLRLAVTPSPDDPLVSNLEARPEVGLLAIDLLAQRRLRLNGRGSLEPEGLFVVPDQVYGNCPKYIRRRRIVGERVGSPASATRSAQLDTRQREWVRRAETFFIASWHPQGGADASHRGGPPGFVEVLDERRLRFPDYPGNDMFNTLGNLVGHPQVGLLFVDFASGDLLHLTGRARVSWDPKTSVEFVLEEAVLRRGAAGLRWDTLEKARD
jgi:predicted pyridoxine 5'-phosphate oxidase superfamily flavin-nucleotide-binding protein